MTPRRNGERGVTAKHDAMRRNRRRYTLAMEHHRTVGHPKGYEGPCWGPTRDDYAHADSILAAEKRAAS